MSPLDSALFFDAIAGRYDREYASAGHESRTRLARVIAELQAPPARVLDLGVGTGRELSALLDAGHLPTGLDASPAMLERCGRRSRPVPLVRADFWAPRLPFEDASFDAVVALHGTLAHPPDDEAMGRLAKEIARVVGVGGRFVAEVPSPAWLDRIAVLPGPGDRRVVRTGPRTCVFHDLVVEASVEARLLDESDWKAAMGAPFDTRIEPLAEAEWLVVARRR